MCMDAKRETGCDPGATASARSALTCCLASAKRWKLLVIAGVGL
jgi:hypothetical protein